MRTLRIFGVIVALSGLLNVATAEIKNESLQQSLTFVIDAGDGSVSLPDVSFDTIGGGTAEEAQATCAMTPGGSTPGTLLEEPAIQLPAPERSTAQTPDETLAPISSLRTPPPPASSGGRYPGPGPDPGGDPTIPPPTITIPVVPEPATLLVVGLGLGAAAFASRRRRDIR